MPDTIDISGAQFNGLAAVVNFVAARAAATPRRWRGQASARARSCRRAAARSRPATSNGSRCRRRRCACGARSWCRAAGRCPGKPRRIGTGRCAPRREFPRRRRRRRPEDTCAPPGVLSGSSVPARVATGVAVDSLFDDGGCRLRPAVARSAHRPRRRLRGARRRHASSWCPTARSRLRGPAVARRARPDALVPARGLPAARSAPPGDHRGARRAAAVLRLCRVYCRVRARVGYTRVQVRDLVADSLGDFS